MTAVKTGWGASSAAGEPCAAGPGAKQLRSSTPTHQAHHGLQRQRAPQVLALQHVDQGCGVGQARRLDDQPGIGVGGSRSATRSWCCWRHNLHKATIKLWLTDRTWSATHLSGLTLRSNWAMASAVTLLSAQQRQPPASCLMWTPSMPPLPPLPPLLEPLAWLPAPPLALLPSPSAPATAAVPAAARPAPLLPSSSAASKPAAPNSLTSTAHTWSGGFCRSSAPMNVVFPLAKLPVMMLTYQWEARKRKRRAGSPCAVAARYAAICNNKAATPELTGTGSRRRRTDGIVMCDLHVNGAARKVNRDALK